MRSKNFCAVLAASALALGTAACGDDEEATSSAASAGSTSTEAATSTPAEKVSGEIKIDGSSTVYPFMQKAAEAFKKANPDVSITVGNSGTGGGFEKFCAGETDISDASRPIKEDEEAPICEKAGIDYAEFQVANDGIAVVTNKALTVDCLTTKQLKELWDKGSKVKDLSELKSDLPSTKLKLFGPGTDSGTFDYFTDEINGEEGQTRDDYSPSEDDNQLVVGVEGSPGGLGYFGYSYAEQNADKLNIVKVDAGDGCVAPSKETIQDGTYKPLARPVFMYPAKKSLEKPQVKAFVDFVEGNYEQIADAAQLVPMTKEQGDKASSALKTLEG